MPQFYSRNEAALAEDYRRDQKMGAEGGNIPLLFLKNGVTEIRILPPYSEAGSFFKEVKEHSSTKDGKFNPIACGRQFGVDCAFCNEGERLFQEGGEDNVQAAREYKPRSNFFFNVLVVSSPTGDVNLTHGVKVMKTGVMVKRDILDIDQDAAAGFADITHPEGGINLRITRQGQGRMNTKYNTKPTSTRTGLPELLATVGSSIEELTMYNLDEVVDVPTAEQIVQALADTNATPGFDAAPPVKAPAQVPTVGPRIPMANPVGPGVPIPAPNPPNPAPPVGIPILPPPPPGIKGEQ